MADGGTRGGRFQRVAGGFMVPRARPQDFIAAGDRRGGALVGEQVRVPCARRACKAADLRAGGDRNGVDRAERLGRAVRSISAVGMKVLFAIGDVLEDRGRSRFRALPELVVAALPDEAVDRRGAALDGRAFGHDRAVGQRGERERVEVGPRRLGQDRAAAQRHRHRAVLGRLDRRARAQEVAVAIGFVVVDEGGPLARDERADVLELDKPHARREREVAVGEHVGVEHAPCEDQHRERPEDPHVPAAPRPQRPALTGRLAHGPSIGRRRLGIGLCPAGKGR